MDPYEVYGLLGEDPKKRFAPINNFLRYMDYDNQFNRDYLDHMRLIRKFGLPDDTSGRSLNDIKQGYRQWLDENGTSPEESNDYDVLGYYLDASNPMNFDVQQYLQNLITDDGRGHGSDRFKKFNHPTYSMESQFSGFDIDGNYHQGGEWFENPPAFIPGKDNSLNPEEMQDYFHWFEPGIFLADWRHKKQ